MRNIWNLFKSDLHQLSCNIITILAVIHEPEVILLNRCTVFIIPVLMNTVEIC